MPTNRIARLCLLLLTAAGTACIEPAPVPRVAGGEPERGRAAIERYGCVACHAIPGIPGPSANVGPPLADLAVRAYVGGVLPNTPDNLMSWLRNPPRVDPRTAMPNLGVSQAEAADMAAYLYAAH